MNLYNPNEKYKEYDYLFFIHNEDYEIRKLEEKLEERTKNKMNFIEKIKELRQTKCVSD